MQAGNDIFDYSRVGHAEWNLPTYETSSFVLGDIAGPCRGKCLGHRRRQRFSRPAETEL